MNIFKLTPKAQRGADWLLVALGVACMGCGWWLWPGQLTVLTLGEVPLKWIANVVVSLYCWWQGYKLVVTQVFK